MTTPAPLLPPLTPVKDRPFHLSSFLPLFSFQQSRRSQRSRPQFAKFAVNSQFQSLSFQVSAFIPSFGFQHFLPICGPK